MSDDVDQKPPGHAAVARTIFLGIEAGPTRDHATRTRVRDVGLLSIVAGAVPVFVLFLTVGPVLVTSLEQAGLSAIEITGGMMAIHIFGGLTGLVLALYYRQPILGAYSIPGIAIAAGALSSISYAEAVGSFIAAGLIVLVLGLTGLAKRIASWVPMPIMNAMVGGILLSFPLGMITDTGADLVLGIATVLGYVVVYRWLPRVPAIVGALVAGVVTALVLGRFTIVPVQWAVATPHFQAPAFSVVALVSVALPLAIAVMGSENMQAIGVLRSVGYRPPVTAMTVSSGLGGLLAGLFGGHNANIAGPGTAACAAPAAGPIRGRYIVAVISGVIVVLFGVFVPVVLQIFDFFPEALMGVLVGLVLVPVVASALKNAWDSRRFTLSVFVTFLVAVSDISPLGISSAFWALLLGCATALLLERDDYRAYVAETE